MVVRTTSDSAQCGKCGSEAKQLFKIRGQAAHICSNCLSDHAAQQGPEKTVTIDGVHRSNSGDDTMVGPSGANGKMN